jgi:uncharacterized protein
MKSRIQIGNTQAIINDSGKDYVILFIHGFQADKNTKQFDMIEQMLLDNHISTLRIDQYGHGSDIANFPDLTITKAITVVKSAIEYLHESGFKHIGIIGSSFGGITGFFASFDSPHVSLMILKSPVCKNMGNLVAKNDNIR